MKVQGFILYKIYYKDFLVYLGRTKQDLAQRIRGHIFKKPMHRTIYAEQVSCIEYAEFQSEADMFLYEIYYVNKLKPPLNVDDKARDMLSVSLPEVEFKPFKCKLWNKWLKEIENMDFRLISNRQKYNGLLEEMRVLRSRHRCGEFSEDEYDELEEALQADIYAAKTKL